MTSELSGHVNSTVDEYLSETIKYKSMIKYHFDKYIMIQNKCSELNALNERTTKEKEEAILIGKRLIYLTNKIGVNTKWMMDGKNDYHTSIGAFNKYQEDLYTSSANIRNKFSKFISAFESKCQYNFADDFNKMVSDIENKNRGAPDVKPAAPKKVQSAPKSTKTVKIASPKIEKKESPKINIKKELKYDKLFK